jgi:hypothetical protein
VDCRFCHSTDIKVSLPTMPTAFVLAGPHRLGASPMFCAVCALALPAACAARNSTSRPDVPVPYGTLCGAGLRETHRARWGS